VLNLFHDEVLFENWTGVKVKGKEALRQAWAPWFRDHGEFRFTPKETFIDEHEQKVVYRWQLDWPLPEKGYKGKHERRWGLDVLHDSLSLQQWSSHTGKGCPKAAPWMIRHVNNTPLPICHRLINHTT